MKKGVLVLICLLGGCDVQRRSVELELKTINGVQVLIPKEHYEILTVGTNGYSSIP